MRVLRELRRAVTESPALPAALLAVGIILVWSNGDGGYDAVYWAPGTLLLVFLVAIVLTNAPGSPPPGRAWKVALFAFAGFVGWCYLSILWADVKSDAWSGANKTLAYFAVYVLFAARPWRARAAGAVLGVYSLGVAAVGVWAFVGISRSATQLGSFIEGRLAEPISYPNANCALFVSAAIPAVYLSSRREAPAMLRGFFLAAAGVLAQLALLCQSRMSLFAVPIVVVVYLALVPGRLRSLLALGLVGAAVAFAGNDLLDVYSAVSADDDVTQTITDARTAILVSGLALLAAGVGWSLLDTRFVVPPSLARAAAIGVTVVAVAGLAASSWAFVDRYGDPVDRAGIWWGTFKRGESVNQADTPHFTSGFGGSGRYEIWSVAVRVFKENPLIGVGVDNFAVDWFRLRTSDKTPLYPHSVELRMLQQTGLVGTSLILLFMGAAGVAAWGALRSGDGLTRGVAGTGLTVFGYWLVHGSVDWLWEIPALSAAAFASLGLAVAVSTTSSSTRTTSRWLLPVMVAVGVAAVVTLVPPWLSAKEVKTALSTWRATPATALDHLDRARALNPLSDEPDVLAAVISAQRGAVGRQRQFLLRAMARNPHNWYPPLEMGLLESRRGRQERALDWLDRATELNPRDRTIQYARERILDGNPPTQAEIDELFVRSADALTGVRQD